MSLSEGELTSIALCWSVERRDGAGLALTSHDRAISRDGLSYEPSPGLTPASIDRSGGVTPASSEVAGALDGEALTEADLNLGRWNGARARLEAIDWQAPEGEAMSLMSGQIGEVSIEGGKFTAELQSAAVKLANPVCPFTSPECRAELGDKACRIDLSTRTRRAQVTASSGHELTLSAPLPAGFLLGRVRYLSGENCGVATSLLSIDGNRIRVRDLPRGEVQPGCTIELREGCDKRLQTCSERFGNAANFRGEPHLPGNDLLTRYPGN